MTQIFAATVVAILLGASAPTAPNAAPKDAAPEMDHGAHCGMPVGEGVVNAVDVKSSRVNITHRPIEAIGWGEMTMDFATAKGVDLAAFAKADNVHFLLEPAKKKDEWRIAAMCLRDAEEAQHDACMTAMHETAMKTTMAGKKKRGGTMKDAACALGAGHEGHGSKDQGAGKKGHDGHH